MVAHVLAAMALMPVAGQPYDLAVLTGVSGAWLRWGVPLFDQWKFGFDLSVLAVGSQSLSYVLQHVGLSGAAALAVAWKLPLVLADLLVGVVLVDLGRQLRCQRPGLVPTLWLISPVPLWVSAGHGQVESLTVLAIVLSLDLLLRRRPLPAGIVLGLGIGIEYLPALVALIVVFWLCVGVIERREVYRFIAGSAGALAFCFGPVLATYIGRTSLLGGLSYTAAVASHTGQAQGTTHAGSSLWAVFDLAPGPFWLVVALSTSIAFMVVLIRKASGTGSASDRRRLGILAAGGLLLCVSLFDPGTLPQFSVLVLGGMCLVALCVDLSPAAIILGPALQLAVGFLFVYGGTFQSYWYDMWATTGAGGWSFPQSGQAAGWASRLGAVVVTLGLALVPSRLVAVTVPSRLRVVVARSSIAAGALGIAFLAIWSLQPGFWQEVGSQGPSALADFATVTASQPGALSMTPTHAQIAFSSPEVLAARESAVPPSLELTVTARPYFAQTTASSALSGRGVAQKLKIPGWKRGKGQVRSLWVSVLLGRPAWRTRAKVLGGVPELMVQGHPISLSETTWVTPGWAVVTYDVPASMVSPSGRLTLGLRENDGTGDLTEWNGTPHVRWLLVSMRSGTATATIDNVRWHGLVTVPSPAATWWYQGEEQASLQVTGLKARPSITVSRVAIGGQQAAVTGGSFAWPGSDGLDHTIHAPLLLALGVVDGVALLGGSWILGRWAAGARRVRVRSRAEALPLRSSGASRGRRDGGESGCRQDQGRPERRTGTHGAGTRGARILGAAPARRGAGGRSLLPVRRWTAATAGLRLRPAPAAPATGSLRPRRRANRGSPVRARL